MLLINVLNRKRKLNNGCHKWSWIICAIFNVTTSVKFASSFSNINVRRPLYSTESFERCKTQSLSHVKHSDRLNFIKNRQKYQVSGFLNTCSREVESLTSLRSASISSYANHTTSLVQALNSSAITGTYLSGSLIENGGVVYTLASGDVNDKKKAKESARRKAILTSIVATAALMTGIYMLIILSGPGSWRYYLAGGICASTSHAITTPIDVLKTRQQVLFQQRKAAGNTLTEPEPSLLRAAMSVLKQPDGMSQLLAGLGPTTVGYLFEGAAKFGVYEVLKPIIHLLVSRNSMNASSAMIKIIGFSICATVSGIVASLMLCPMEAIRIRIVSNDSEEKRHPQSLLEKDMKKKNKNWVSDGLRMLRKEGIGGMYKGLVAMLAKQVPYTVTKQVSFDIGATILYRYVKAVLSPNNLVQYSRTILIFIPLISAALASFLSCISSQPGDMLLSLVNASAGSKTTRDFAREIYQEGGMRGFFVGMKARFVHVGLIVTVQLLIYDLVKRMCGIAATGCA